MIRRVITIELLGETEQDVNDAFHEAVEMLLNVVAKSSHVEPGYGWAFANKPADEFTMLREPKA